jgi:hypothetical protein
MRRLNLMISLIYVDKYLQSNLRAFMKARFGIGNLRSNIKMADKNIKNQAKLF